MSLVHIVVINRVLPNYSYNLLSAHPIELDNFHNFLWNPRFSLGPAHFVAFNTVNFPWQMGRCSTPGNRLKFVECGMLHVNICNCRMPQSRMLHVASCWTSEIALMICNSVARHILPKCCLSGIPTAFTAFARFYRIDYTSIRCTWRKWYFILSRFPLQYAINKIIRDSFIFSCMQSFVVWRIKVTIDGNISRLWSLHDSLSYVLNFII